MNNIITNRDIKEEILQIKLKLYSLDELLTLSNDHPTMSKSLLLRKEKLQEELRLLLIEEDDMKKREE